jgi:hypothetical protein
VKVKVNLLTPPHLPASRIDGDVVMMHPQEKKISTMKNLSYPIFFFAPDIIVVVFCSLAFVGEIWS